MLPIRRPLLGLILRYIAQSEHIVIGLHDLVALVVPVYCFVLHLARPVSSHLSLAILFVVVQSLLVLSKLFYIVFDNSTPYPVLLLLQAGEVHSIAVFLVRLLPVLLSGGKGCGVTVPSAANSIRRALRSLEGWLLGGDHVLDVGLTSNVNIIIIYER